MVIAKLRVRAPVIIGLTGSVTFFSFHGNIQLSQPIVINLHDWIFLTENRSKYFLFPEMNDLGEFSGRLTPFTPRGDLCSTLLLFCFSIEFLKPNPRIIESAIRHMRSPFPCLLPAFEFFRLQCPHRDFRKIHSIVQFFSRRISRCVDCMRMDPGPTIKRLSAITSLWKFCQIRQSRIRKDCFCSRHRLQLSHSFFSHYEIPDQCYHA
jgi:hypothetical protein